MNEVPCDSFQGELDADNSFLRSQQAVGVLEKGSVEIEGEVLDASTDLEFKLEFSRAGDEWESMSKADGSLVIAIDCQQDESILSAGMSRELINGIQQLRKAAGLDLTDVVEIFYAEDSGETMVEDAVKSNVAVFEAKFKGAVPVPKRFAPDWSVVLKSDTVEVGGSNVTVSICRPCLAAKGIDESAMRVLATLEPSALKPGQTFSFSVDGKQSSLVEGKDFWLSTQAMVRSFAS